MFVRLCQLDETGTVWRSASSNMRMPTASRCFSSRKAMAAPAVAEYSNLLSGPVP